MAITPLEMPATIDEMARELAQLKNGRADLTDQIDEKEKVIVKLAERNGHIPDGAPKTIRLCGDEWNIDVTFGTTTSIDNDVVGEIQATLATAGKPGLFKKLFHAQTKYIVAPTAQSILSAAPAKVRKLFARVLAVKPRKPSVSVERRKK